MTALTSSRNHVVASTQATLSTLVRLRLAAALAQIATILVVRAWLTPHLAVEAMLPVVVVLLGSNWVLARRAPRIVNPKHWVFVTLLLDVLLLTVLLSLSGGAHNPFTILYLVHVALTAIMLGPLELVVVLVTCVAGYGTLFVWYVPLPACLGGQAHDGSGFSAHLHGMWVAFLIAATATAGFMYRLSTALAKEREINDRQLRLLGLATLAAGAAHEIGNPLATIKVAASELKRELEMLGEPGWPLALDTELIVSEVERAWKAIRGLADSAGELTGEPIMPVAVTDLLRQLREQVLPSSIELDVRTRTPDARMLLPARAVVTALTQVVRNAIQASPIGAVVELEVVLSHSRLRVSVQDRGTGIPSQILRRLGEPFLTTKEPGHGMGLGLFVTRSLVERLNGDLAISNRVGGGTSVLISLPALEVGQCAL